MTDAHSDRVSKFEKGVQDGTMHAPWKDEVWERDNGTVGVMLGSHDQNGPPGSQSDWATLAGYVFSDSYYQKYMLMVVYSDAAQLKLADLAKGKIIREGDVLSYRRNFSQLGIDIEKDVLVRPLYTFQDTSNSQFLRLIPSTLEQAQSQLLFNKARFRCQTRC